jgi:methyl-accepting chemotaxis protein
MTLSLKNKIVILVSLPSFSLLLLIAIFISRNYSEYLDAVKAYQYVKYSNATSRFIHEIQIERGKSSLYLGGKIAKEELSKQRDKSIQLQLIYNETILLHKDSSDLVKLKEGTLKDLEEARKIVDANGAAPEAVKLFSQVVRQLILSEIYVAHNAKASGDEKKLLSVTMLDMAKENAGKLRANITNVINADKELTPQQIQLISSLLAGLNENLSSPTLVISEQSKSALDIFRETSEWKKAQEIILHVLDNASKGAFNLNSNVFFESITTAINNLGTIIFSEQDLVSDLILKKKESLTRSLVLIIAFNSLLLIVVVSLSLYFIKSITGPIQSLVVKLNESSRDVNSSSEKVSEASEQLSQNSTKQAAALQEAVASLEEITQMVAKTADNALVSQKSSEDSFEMAQTGHSVVIELNQSISDITNSNEQIKEKVLQSNVELGEISKIISEIGNKTRVINDIVFQTKLLSFNASVEAARAGEQGKGFAVVAEEIGKLAEMSGNSAKEISDVLDKSLNLVDSTIEKTKKEIIFILDQSRETVKQGSKTAEKCGQSLVEIVGKVQEVNRLVVEIATASNEQSQGMSQISIAMNELDHATHSNSASSVETAQFGLLLKNQSDDLNNAIKDLSKVIYG